jgi:peptide/nickel transport system permease protein
MLRYILRRLITMIPLLVLITSLTYFLGQYGAGDLAAYLTTQEGGGKFNWDAYYKIRAELGLDDPPIVRYGRWLSGAVRGDLGKSYVLLGQPDVTYLLKKALPVSMQLGLAALAIVAVLGIPLGVSAAVMRNGPLDYLIVGSSTVLASVPTFVLAPIAMIVIVLNLKLLPSVPLGWHGLFDSRTILPALVLAAGPLLGVVRYTRASVLEVLSQEYVRLARAKGLPERLVVVKHVVKNSMTPVLTVLGLTAAGLVGGSIFVEQIFNLPGFGSLAGRALQMGDLQTSTGTILVSGLIIMVANLLVDLCYGLLDPRVRLTGK